MTGIDQLTSAQLLVFEQMILGLSNQQIANQLFINIKTVKFHVTQIYEKCAVKTRAELLVKHFTQKNQVPEPTPTESELPKGIS